jgi:hypothetical protein
MIGELVLIHESPVHRQYHRMEQPPVELD